MARTKKERLLLVDGDLILYKITAANQKSIRFHEYEFPANNWEECLDGFTTSMRTFKQRFGTTDIKIFFTDSKNFRKDLLPSYKANRTGLRPQSFASCRADLIKQGAIKIPTIEADDCIGIYATMPENNSKEVIIISSDKDFKTIPGAMLCDPDASKDIAKGSSKLVSDRMFYTQILTGDTADNYKGCPGIGPVKAAAVLEECKNEKEMWQAVLGLYESKGLTADDALLQGRMARILQYGDFCLTTNKVNLWTPKT